MELMLTMRYLIQKNETLTLMRDEIDNLKNSEGNYPVKFIKKLDNYLAQGLEMQTKEWQLAMNNLKLSQEGYFRKLKEKYPKLTSNDVRMCSYLRMNFNSKKLPIC
jgi:lipopolysaccharide assembly outer membrane protein LptD (OstA)